MLNAVLNLLGMGQNKPQAAQDPVSEEHFRLGDRVRREDGLIGVISAWDRSRGQRVARVVFQGRSSSFIQWIVVDELTRA